MSTTMTRLPTDAVLNSLTTVDAVRAVARALRDELRAALTRDAQGGAVGCDHRWHDYGQRNVCLCAKCQAQAVIGYEERPFIGGRAERVTVPDNVRGEIALDLQSRNRHLEVSTARYFVDAVCDLLAALPPQTAEKQP